MERSSQGMATKLEINLPAPADLGSEWMPPAEEGQLSVDVYQDRHSIYVISTIAGVKPQNLEISISNDMLTIRGQRQGAAIAADADYFVRECFWGKFSRSIILPVDIKTDEVEASLENGVLTIKLPKSARNRSIPITLK